MTWTAPFLMDSCSRGRRQGGTHVGGWAAFAQGRARTTWCLSPEGLTPAGRFSRYPALPRTVSSTILVSVSESEQRIAFWPMPRPLSLPWFQKTGAPKGNPVRRRGSRLCHRKGKHDDVPACTGTSPRGPLRLWRRVLAPLPLFAVRGSF